MKVVLEQGDPFPNKLFKENGATRIVLGLYLLVGIVLSNGYKNENVYNMVSPLKPTKFKKFQEAFASKLKVYTYARTVLIGNFTLFLSTDLDTHSGFLQEAGEMMHNIVVCKKCSASAGMFLDTFSLGYSLVAFVISILGKNYVDRTKLLTYESNLELNQNEIAVNNSGLRLGITNKVVRWYLSKYPTWMMPLKDAEASVLSLLQVKSGISKQIEEKYKQVEKSVLFEELRQCRNKTALLLSWLDAQNITIDLEKEGVYIGREEFRKPVYTFQFSGLVSSNWIIRLGKFKETGIVRRWIEILKLFTCQGSLLTLQ